MEYHFGGSPGGGILEPKMSRDPLATEGEATIGPDNYNPYEQEEFARQFRELQRRDALPRYDNELVDDVPPPEEMRPSMAEPLFDLSFELPALGGGSGPRLPDF